MAERLWSVTADLLSSPREGQKVWMCVCVFSGLRGNSKYVCLYFISLYPIIHCSHVPDPPVSTPLLSPTLAACIHLMPHSHICSHFFKFSPPLFFLLVHSPSPISPLIPSIPSLTLQNDLATPSHYMSLFPHLFFPFFKRSFGFQSSLFASSMI